MTPVPFFPQSSPLALAMTGASGAAYGLRFLHVLLEQARPVYLMLSQAARLVIKTETNLDIPTRPADIAVFLEEYYQATPGQLQVFGKEDWFAPVASGSNVPQALVICPCSSGTLAAVASGAARTLIERAADVVLKERRQLILVHRETPLSLIHLENMLRLTQAGAVIMPASPGFYQCPQRVEDLVDFMVARILDHLRIPHQLSARWGETHEPT
jgi:flavin prenyltransferase